MSFKYLIEFRPKLTLSHFKTDYRWTVDGSSATMYEPFVPLFYQAIIMIEEV